MQYEQNVSGKPMRRPRPSLHLAPLRVPRETPEVCLPIANVPDEMESDPEAVS
jgi:hypothetical protein